MLETIARVEQGVGHRDEGAVEAAEVVVGNAAEEGRAEDGDCRIHHYDSAAIS